MSYLDQRSGFRDLVRFCFGAIILVSVPIGYAAIFYFSVVLLMLHMYNTASSFELYFWSISWLSWIVGSICLVDSFGGILARKIPDFAFGKFVLLGGMLAVWPSVFFIRFIFFG